MNAFSNGDIRVVVCTDTGDELKTSNVKHVVNFEMPFYFDRYLNRIGRLDKTNGGSVTSYVIKKPEVDLVWQIERSIRLGKRLNDIDT